MLYSYNNLLIQQNRHGLLSLLQEGPLNTFCALQAVARHVEAGSHRLEGRHRALDWMNQEQGPLLALNTVEWYHCGAVGADQHLGWIRIGQRINSVSLCCRAVRLWKVHTYTPRSSSVLIHTSCCTFLFPNYFMCINNTIGSL